MGDTSLCFIRVKGSKMSLGPTIDRPVDENDETDQQYEWVDDHEYIVYNADQVALRYLIQFL